MKQLVRAERFFGRGAALARAVGDGAACVVARLLPGEVAVVEIDRPGYLPQARLLSIEVASSHRVVSPCNHYAQCDGCALLHADEEADADNAASVVREVLERHADGIDLPEVERLPVPPFIGHRTRSSMNVTVVDGQVKIGLRDREGNSNHIPDCPALAPALRAAATTCARLIVPADVGDGAGIELATTASGLTVSTRQIGEHSIAALEAHALAAHTGSAADWTSPSPAGSEAVRNWVRSLGVHQHATIYDATAGSGDLAAALAGDAVSMLLGDVDHLALRIAAQRVGERCALVEVRAGKLETISARLLREGRAFDVVVVNPMRRSLGDDAMTSLAALAQSHLVYLGPAPRAAALDIAAVARAGFALRRLGASIWYPRSGRAMLCALLTRRDRVRLDKSLGDDRPTTDGVNRRGRAQANNAVPPVD